LQAGKLVYLAYRFLVFCRDFIPFIMLKVEGKGGGHREV
jgi:hypothetical protein